MLTFLPVLAVLNVLRGNGCRKRGLQDSGDRRRSHSRLSFDWLIRERRATTQSTSPGAINGAFEHMGARAPMLGHVPQSLTIRAGRLLLAGQRPWQSLVWRPVNFVTGRSGDCILASNPTAVIEKSSWMNHRYGAAGPDGRSWLAWDTQLVAKSRRFWWRTSVGIPGGFHWNTQVEVAILINGNRVAAIESENCQVACYCHQTAIGRTETVALQFGNSAVRLSGALAVRMASQTQITDAKRRKGTLETRCPLSLASPHASYE